MQRKTNQKTVSTDSHCSTDCFLHKEINQPFSLQYNDHPSNGIALCKNHHWAMDRHLITPDLNLEWQVSPLLDSRRSASEDELLSLSGKTVLMPKERSYYPNTNSVQWRLERLLRSNT